MSKRRPILLHLPGAKALATKTHLLLGKAWQMIPVEVKYFGDGEMKTVLPAGSENSVRGADTYVVQTGDFGYGHSPQDVFFELASAVANLTESGANFRTVVSPWYFYACQDKKRRREPLTARLAADFLMVAGATHVVSVDLHNDAIQGFFDRRQCNFNGLYASWLLLRHLNAQFQIPDHMDEFAISGVDQGSGTRIKYLATHTGLMAVLPAKIKDYQTGKTREIIINEPVNGKNVVVFDDMIRSGGSIVETAKALKAKGAKSIVIAITHADFCGSAIADLDALHRDHLLSLVVCTDSFAFPDDFSQAHPWFYQVSLADMLAETISNLHEERSLSHLYLDDRALE